MPFAPLPIFPTALQLFQEDEVSQGIRIEKFRVQPEEIGRAFLWKK
jgi:hypothetical protein